VNSRIGSEGRFKKYPFFRTWPKWGERGLINKIQNKILSLELFVWRGGGSNNKF